MGPLGRRLPFGAAAGKALSEVADGEGASDAPIGSDGRERPEHEAASGELRMGDGERPRAELAAAPQHDVEVKHARPPAAAAAAAEFAFDGLEAAKHLGWVEVAFDQRDGIGEVAAGAAMGGVEDDWGSVE